MRVSTRKGQSPDEDGKSRSHALDTRGQIARTKAISLRVADLLTDVERDVERAHIHMRKDVHTIARELNMRVSQVIRTIARIRTKYAKQGEIMLAQPDSAHLHETRTRYDSLIATLRADFARVPPDMFGVRVKLARTIADIERMRDDALRAFGLGSTDENAHMGVVYVSHLRANGGDESPQSHAERARNAKRVHSLDDDASNARAKEPRSTPTPGPVGAQILPPSPSQKPSHDA